MASQAQLPETHLALVLDSTDKPPTVKLIPTPQAGPGSVVVRILLANVLSYSRDIYNGNRNYPYPLPLVIGTSAVARIVATGPDTTSLCPGQLILIDTIIHGRDDPTSTFLLGIHQGFTDGSRKLMHGEWRDATYAEYCKVPLENCHLLDEARLLGATETGGLGYTMKDLARISAMLVPYGGLRDIKLAVGETIIIAPATGNFGSAAIRVALAMGARVVAMGRNMDALRRLDALTTESKQCRLPMTLQPISPPSRKFGPIDAFLDISPPAAANSTHIKTCILALRHSGRGCLMGGIIGDVGIPHGAFMHGNLALRGKWMYEKEDVRALIRMVEGGIWVVAGDDRLENVRSWALEEWDQAFEAAERAVGTGLSVVITP